MLELYLSRFYDQQKKRASLSSSSLIIKDGRSYPEPITVVPPNIKEFLQRKSGIVFKRKENWMLVIHNNQLFTRDAVLFLDEMATSHGYQLMTDESELTSGFWSLTAHLNSMPVLSLHSSRGLPRKAGLNTDHISLIIGLTVTRAHLYSQLSSLSWLSPVLLIHQFLLRYPCH